MFMDKTCPVLGGGFAKNNIDIVLALCERSTLKKSLDMSIKSKCIVNFFTSLYLCSSIECSNLMLVALQGVERSEIGTPYRWKCSLGSGSD